LTSAWSGKTVVTVVASPKRVSWIVLVHRVPREPSSPRIAIWRRLRSLGVAQLGDGICALPEDARTREQLEWVADQVLEAGGTALLVRGETLSSGDERQLVGLMSTARGAEYAELSDRVTHLLEAGPGREVERRRALRSVRRELRAIQRRDHFPPPERERASVQVAELGRRWLEATAAATESVAL
jgi:hypothetical protein